MTAARFRKKPVVIEAMQFTGENHDEILGWATRFRLDDPVKRSVTGIYVDTLEGAMAVSVGDWVIRGVAGEFYPCKPDIFEQTYEPVAEETA